MCQISILRLGFIRTITRFHSQRVKLITTDDYNMAREGEERERVCTLQGFVHHEIVKCVEYGIFKPDYIKPLY
jgi:hypothetical protein